MAYDYEGNSMSNTSEWAIGLTEEEYDLLKASLIVNMDRMLSSDMMERLLTLHGRLCVCVNDAYKHGVFRQERTAETSE